MTFHSRFPEMFIIDITNVKVPDEFVRYKVKLSDSKTLQVLFTGYTYSLSWAVKAARAVEVAIHDDIVSGAQHEEVTQLPLEL